MDFSKETLKGLLDTLVLFVILEEPKHGYRIAKAISEMAKGELEIQDGTLYPILHRLEKRGLIAGQWQDDGSARKRKDYRLTPAGLAVLRDHATQWKILAKMLNQVTGAVL